MKIPFFFCLLALALPRVLDAEPARPNIVIIMADDHTRQAISAYNPDPLRAQTPQIDRLAQGGMLFQHMLCNNAICSPSRAAILSGAYGHVNGVKENRSGLNDDIVTLPEILRDNGYQTAIFGKWHLHKEPKGFTHYFLFRGQGNYGNNKMKTPANDWDVSDDNVFTKGYVTDYITDHALDWLDRRDTEKPFLAMIHHKASHGPWKYHDRHAGLYEAGTVPRPSTLFDDFATRTEPTRTYISTMERLYETRAGWIGGAPPDHLSDTEKWIWAYEHYMEHYLRTSQALDDNVGRVLDWLESNHLEENTIVIYTSDQGFFMGEHGWYDKRLMFEDALNMPFIVRYPTEIAAGARTDALVGNHDIAPTLLDFAGVEARPPTMQGRTFRPVLQGGERPDWTHSFYYRYYEKQYGGMPIEGVRTDRHKLIHYYEDAALELYDLLEDPLEVNNLIASPEAVEIRDLLLDELDRLRTHYGAPKVPDPRALLKGGTTVSF